MADRPVEVAYFYKTKWGHHDEFLELFTRNHLPVLREQVESGRMLDVRVQVPRFHGDGRADWDVLVTIVYRDWPAMGVDSDTKIIQNRIVCGKGESMFSASATVRDRFHNLVISKIKSAQIL